LLAAAAAARELMAALGEEAIGGKREKWETLLPPNIAPLAPSREAQLLLLGCCC
jgi:hypothetical protein